VTAKFKPLAALQITADMRLVHAALGGKIPAASCCLYLLPPPNTALRRGACATQKRSNRFNGFPQAQKPLKRFRFD
jgi:hypothetical protein